jgi:integrase
MSEGSVYQRADGRWCAKWQDVNGKWRYLYRKNKAEARKALREALKDRDSGIIPASKQTVSRVVDEWLIEKKVEISSRTHVIYESLIRCHVKTHPIAKKRVNKLSPEDVHSFYRDKLKEGVASSTVRRIHAIMKQALPIRARAPSIRHKEMVILSKEEVKRLLAACRDNRLECVYVLGATCGLRVGEALALRVEDVDLGRGTLTIRRTLWRGKTYPPKTERSHRTVKLPRVALDALGRYLARNGNPSEGWLFQTKHGNPVNAPNLHGCWKRLLREANLPNIKFHGLRHTAVSLMLSQNVPLTVVSRVCGHANPNITATVYSHMLDGMEDLGADGMDEALG